MPVSRPLSPSLSSSRPAKKQKIEATAGPIALPPSADLKNVYESSGPYKHLSVGGLFDDQLRTLSPSRGHMATEEKRARCLGGAGSEKKLISIETIQQTPDLTSLDPEHLPQETLDKLPHLCKLKEKIYSSEFREFIRGVTGCGPLSGQKMDGSVGLYTKGSHLLLHDDSISTRVVSYILYLPNSPTSLPSAEIQGLPLSSDGHFVKGWRPEWGGALELYPVENDEPVGPPRAKRTAKVDVQWGNLVFFEVQPGRSYHSVEEVVVGDGRQRLGISGWFHRPVEGEEGYAVQDSEQLKANFSSLAQITAAPTIPLTPYAELTAPPGLTSTQLKYLSNYLSPSYLQNATLEKLAGQFVEGSEIVMYNFLNPEIIAQIEKEMKEMGSESANGNIAAQAFGEDDAWTIQGPPSKHRYLTLAGRSTKTPTIYNIVSELFPSNAFRAWVEVVSSLVLTGYKVEGRRFRRGLDYTLAAGEDKEGEARLDGVLGLSSWAPSGPEDQDGDEEDVGGWEVYLAAPEENSDPAVFQSNKAPKVTQPEAVASSTPPENYSAENAEAGPSNGLVKPSITLGGVELEFDESQFSPSDFDSDSENGVDDGPLLHVPMGFNKFLLVLRDPGVMKFVKYLSNSAAGSRYDVCAEWSVGQLEDDEEDEAEE